MGRIPQVAPLRAPMTAFFRVVIENFEKFNAFPDIALSLSSWDNFYTICNIHVTTKSINYVFSNIIDRRHWLLTRYHKDLRGLLFIYLFFIYRAPL